MVTNKANYRLGLDLGTNSIGWAAVQLDDHGEPCGLLDLGVRIFPDGRDRQSKQSNAAERRVARGQRRRRDRYLMRRNDLMQSLIEFGLMPDDEAGRKQLEKADPYELRSRALDEPLRPFELGRALFHLNQRRGFKSNRKASADEKEDGQVKAAISELRRRITVSGARTLGEFLARQHGRGEAVRARPETGLRADRAMYEDEFDAIRCAQETHQSLSAEQWQSLRGSIFSQRDLRPVEPGWCQFEFESQERRAAKALPLFQEFRMMQEVNNLRVRVGLEPERRLRAEERDRAMKRLRSGNRIDLNKPPRDLGLPSGAFFNLSAGGRKSIKGDETAARLASTGKKATAKKPAEPALFGKRWFDFSPDERNEIVRFLLDTEEQELVRQRAVAEWGMNAEQADSVANVSLPPGYGNLSEKAIRKILPHLENGLVFSDAVREAGYQHHSAFGNGAAHDGLPYYGAVLERDAVGANPEKDPQQHGEVSRYGRIANPTVHIGLGQLRRVVNRLTETYGKPEEIVVELARDLKMNQEQKRNYEQQQRAGGKRNDDFRKMLEESGRDVTADALRKLRLWEEQKLGAVKVCPYTGKPLSFEMVMSAQTEVDHILPFSRTLDNSMGNLVVCLADANRAKGSKTPYEAYDDLCLEYVKDFPSNKRWRFQENAMERFEGEHDFLDRQLNETQYLSRTARTYLAYLYDERGEHRQRVCVVPGRMTALLRRGWGLEGLLNDTADGEIPRKTRDDHRHHAVDAFVVANTTQGLLKSFADAAGSGLRDAEERLASLVPPPWPDFDRRQVKERLDHIVVSHKPDRGTRGPAGRTSGRLHEATAYGIIEPIADGRHRVVLRKELSAFTEKDLNHVTDPALQEALRRLWKQQGGRPAEFAKHAADTGVCLNGRLQRVRKVRIHSERRVIPVKDAGGKAYKGYLPGGNEFADIWRLPDGNWQTVVVSTFEANQMGSDLNSFRPHPAARRLMRVQIDDMGALEEGANRRIVRVRKINNRSGRPPTIVLDDHNEANAAEGKDIEFSARQMKDQNFRCVRVDETGRVSERGPFNP